MENLETSRACVSLWKPWIFPPHKTVSSNLSGMMKSMCWLPNVSWVIVLVKFTIFTSKFQITLSLLIFENQIDIFKLILIRFIKNYETINLIISITI